MAGFLDNMRSGQSLTTLFRNLSKISKMGMEYQDMIIRNSQTIGKTEVGFVNSEGSGATVADAFRWTSALQDTRVRKYIAYFDKDYAGKRDFLRKFSLNGEIEFILDTMSDEIIIQDSKNFFAYPDMVNLDLKDKIKDKVFENFQNIYSLFGFTNSNLGWQYIKQFLIDGFLALEIVYDNNGKKIVGFKELDALSLQPTVEKVGPDKYEQFWIQYPGNAHMTRKLKDEQIIYLSYAKGNAISRVSYVERLVRSYNILRIMENTRVIWNVMNASYRLKFIIPVGTQSQQKALQTLGQLMSNYKEEIELNDTSGELTVNGRPKVQFYKNYMFPEKNGESPQIESLNPSGPDFNVMESVVYFFNKLKQDSKIPYARFASRGGTPANHQININQMERDEMRFGKFLNRIRSNFQELLIKPLYIQMCLDHPELATDQSFKSNLGINFIKESEFALKIKLSQLTKRAAFIGNLSRLSEKIVGGEEEPYFDTNFLVQKFLGLTPDEIKSNSRYKKELKKISDAKKKEEEASDGEGDKEEPGASNFTL